MLCCIAPLYNVLPVLLILAAADLQALIQEQAIALIEKLNKKTQKQRLLAAVSDLEHDSDDSDNNNDDTSKANPNEGSDDNNNPYTWIGKWVQKPNGKHCQSSKDSHEGFTTTRLLEQAGISKGQYTMYKVCV